MKCVPLSSTLWELSKKKFNSIFTSWRMSEDIFLLAVENNKHDIVEYLLNNSYVYTGSKEKGKELSLKFGYYNIFKTITLYNRMIKGNALIKFTIILLFFSVVLMPFIVLFKMYSIFSVYAIFLITFSISFNKIDNYFNSRLEDRIIRKEEEIYLDYIEQI